MQFFRDFQKRKEIMSNFATEMKGLELKEMTKNGNNNHAE